MQYEITNPGPLLDGDGHLNEAGYARRLIRDYDRESVKAPRLRIKEWDYYYAGNDKYGIALTVADNSYMGLLSASVLDFTKPWQHTASKIIWFTRGSIGLPASSVKGDVHAESNGIHFSFQNDGVSRNITCGYKNFRKGMDFECDITLREILDDSMVIATPFPGKPKYFYYNQKINCLTAEGTAKLGSGLFTFNPNDSFGVLDWGRGVWTYNNTWYWASASGMVQGSPFGFNFGYGFGDTKKATENMLFYQGKAHKLGEVAFEIPKTRAGKFDYTGKWRIVSNDARVNLSFTPVIDRYANTNALVIQSKQHQVFGRFDGEVIPDDGSSLGITGLTGFAEQVHNRW